MKDTLIPLDIIFIDQDGEVISIYQGEPGNLDIAKEDNVKLLTSTASPYNKYSVSTFENLGYKIKKDKIKYGGLRRYVLAKEL